ncbi:MAG: proline--tRNA ligase, partial [Bifidobacteriaceae bacterium]|nr:proline--tRNA ligase [Bifidobacteriaceae bacterium]
PKTLIMGSYGIGVSRLLATLAESKNDNLGLAWPISVAPAFIHIVAAGKDLNIYKTAYNIAKKLENNNIEIILDDRQISAGVKFKDAELLGVPYILTVGQALANSAVEIKKRDGTEKKLIKLDKIIDYVNQIR